MAGQSSDTDGLAAPTEMNAISQAGVRFATELDFMSDGDKHFFMGPLDQKARDALRAIYSRGLIRGRDLKRLANLTDGELRTGLTTLINGNFVTIQGCSGLALDQNLSDVYVAPLPSKRSEAEYEMKQLG